MVTKTVAHTPGPWTWMQTPSVHTLDFPRNAPDVPWNGLGEVDSFDELRGADSYVLLGGWCNDSTADIMVSNSANARLIAAAPEMLRVLEQIAFMGGELQHKAPEAQVMAEMAREVIRLARATQG